MKTVADLNLREILDTRVQLPKTLQTVFAAFNFFFEQDLYKDKGWPALKVIDDPKQWAGCYSHSRDLVTVNIGRIKTGNGVAFVTFHELRHWWQRFNGWTVYHRDINGQQYETFRGNRQKYIPDFGDRVIDISPALQQEYKELLVERDADWTALKLFSRFNQQKK